MADPILIVDPPDGAKNVAGKSFNVVVQHQLQGGLAQGASTLQYSSEETGPWVTAQPAAGPLRAPAVPFDAQASTYTISGVTQALPLFVRVGIWPDAGLSGNPTHAGEVAHWGVVVSHVEKVAPDRGEGEAPDH